jgi:LPPG:FO 2-phospho-L-lactate transferase
MAMMQRYGGTTWFILTDGDLGTHLFRTERLGQGQTLTAVTQAIASGWELPATLLPMCDTPVATRVLTPDGELAFQDYFVRRRHQDRVLSVRFAGLENAVPTPQVTAALRDATVIVFCPSNPIVSIGPILALPGLRDQLRSCRVPRVGVSPIIGGAALKGPADQMLASLGHESSAVGVAKLYRDVLDGFVIDKVDAAQQADIEALGLRVLVTDAIMHDREDRVRLAQEILDFVAHWRPVESR